MATVSVSKLKASLSEYLARVQAGEEVTVMSRKRPVAKLVPIAEIDGPDRPMREMTVDSPYIQSLIDRKSTRLNSSH